MSSNQCCVPGCDNSSDVRYSFPTIEPCLNEWLKRINTELLEKESKILTNYMICPLHFTPSCFERNGELKKLALPTLNLPGYVSLHDCNNQSSSRYCKETTDQSSSRDCKETTDQSSSRDCKETTDQSSSHDNVHNNDPLAVSHSDTDSEEESIVEDYCLCGTEAYFCSDEDCSGKKDNLIKLKSGAKIRRHRKTFEENLFLLDNFPAQCGMNPEVSTNLEKLKRRRKRLNRYSVLTFARVALDHDLTHNCSKNCANGVVNHALIFILKGVYKRWQHPVCYFFCENTSAEDLVQIIKEVVREVHRVGLYIVATVTNQEAANTCAVDKLLEETREYCLKNEIEKKIQSYVIDGKEIIHLYDPHHLLVDIRNDFFTKDLYYCLDGVQKVASLSQLVEGYNKMEGIGKIPKRTNELLLPDELMLFSQTLGAYVHFVGRMFQIEQVRDTGMMLIQFDSLFDSVSGGSSRPPEYKPLKGLVKAKSKHVETWERSLSFLNSIYFKDKSTNESTTNSAVKHFISVVHSFQYIWEFLKQKGFGHMIPVSFNLDPIFFNCEKPWGVEYVENK